MTDQTARLQSLIDLATPGARVDLAPGVYDLAGTLVLRKPVTLTGTGVTLRALPSTERDRCVVDVVNTSTVTIDGLTIIGASTVGGSKLASRNPLEGQHGIRIRGSSNVTVKGCTISQTWGDGVYVALAPDSAVRKWSSGVTISGSWIHHTTRHGVCLNGVEHVDITRNLIHDTTRATVDIEPSAATGARWVTIDGNLVGRSGLLFVAAQGHTGDVSHVAITNNDLRGDTLDIWLGDLDGGRRSDYVITGNRSNTPAGNPSNAVILASRIDGLLVKGNTQPMAKLRAMRMVRASGCQPEVEANELGPYGAGQVLTT